MNEENENKTDEVVETSSEPVSDDKDTPNAITEEQSSTSEADDDSSEAEKASEDEKETHAIKLPQKFEDVWDKYLNEPSPEEVKKADAPPEPEITETDSPPSGAHGESSGDDEVYIPDAVPLSSIKESDEQVFSRLDNIEGKLDLLFREFQGKLKYDSHKDKIIDELHRELQDYKDGMIKKHLKSMIMDLIKIIDNIRRLTEHYKAQNPSNADPKKLIRLLENIPSDLEDLCHLQGVEPYTCKGKNFDATRQRVLKKIETKDIVKDKTIAMSLRPGYEWDEKIIRPELVAVYVYSEGSVEKEVRNSDE